MFAVLTRDRQKGGCRFGPGSAAHHSPEEGSCCAAPGTHKAGGQSGCTPDAFTIAGQRLISSARNSPYCRVDQFCGSKPSLAILAMSSGDLSAALNAPLSCSTIGPGVPAVVRTP